MYTHKYYYTLLLVFVLAATSCRNYVELEPQGYVTPTEVSDYQMLLDNSKIFNLSYSSVEYLTDDISMLDVNFINSRDDITTRMYQWADSFYASNQEDPEWNLFYQQIYYANVVIKGIPDAKGDESLKQQLIAQAKVHRAYAYLCLINMYAKPYVAASAATDLGLPLLKEPSYTQNLKRASIQDVYDFILSDLVDASTVLPSLPFKKVTPSKAAAYALLARAYLYMGNYQKALDNANLLLAIQSTLLDITPYIGMGAANGMPGLDGYFLPKSESNPEVILMKASNAGGIELPLSPELMTLLGSKDARAIIFTYIGPGGSLDPYGMFKYPGLYVAYWAPFETVAGSFQEGPTVPEMMLIKAECLARTQRGQDGLVVVNALRLKRFKTVNYTALTATTDAAALTLILQERRRELFAKGFRLFDLKRYNLDPSTRVTTVTHPFKGQTLQITAGSNRYVYPIPAKVIIANPEIVQNPR
jgi:tetratricopeptide (TPR) repeat protein